MPSLLTRLDAHLPGYRLRHAATKTWKGIIRRARAPRFEQALNFANRWRATANHVDRTSTSSLESYFDAHHTGPGLWKWRHYFEIYERHFGRFVGQPLHLLEIGVYSGGSLDMWRHYFGPLCQITGVDIEPAVRAYEADGVRIVIGDQGDEAFWHSVLPTIPPIDIVIDDGGHQAHQQIATLQALLPHMNPGGVFLCEDIHGENHEFVRYVGGLIAALNAQRSAPHPETPTYAVPTDFQRAIHSVHCYPFVTVIEVREQRLRELIAPRHGTQWQPFYEPSHVATRGRK